jgi:uncharacterized protein YkwD
MKNAALIGIVAISWGYVTGVNAQQFTVPNQTNQYLLDQTNAYRVQKGRQKLTAHQPANVAANQYAEFLAKNNRPKPDEEGEKSHFLDGSTPAKRVAAANHGTACDTWENVFHSYTTPKADPPNAAVDKAMTFWKNSPGHEENLRRPVTAIGIGIFGWQHGNDYWYTFVQDFTICPNQRPVRTPG